jgi:hypothetical protein
MSNTIGRSKEDRRHDVVAVESHQSTGAMKRSTSGQRQGDAPGIQHEFYCTHLVTFYEDDMLPSFYIKSLNIPRVKYSSPANHIGSLANQPEKYLWITSV